MTVSIVDLLVVVIYMLGMVAIGFAFVGKTKKASEYYNANRSLGIFVLAATVCATMMGGSSLIGRGGLAYTSGVNAIILGLPYPIGMFIFAGMSGKIQRLGAGKYGVTSVPHLMEIRFGKTVKIVSTVIIGLSMAAVVSGSVAATATIFSLLGGDIGITYELGTILAAVVFVLYTMTSGFLGVVYTDVAQFLVMVVFVFIAMPIVATIDGGGFSEVIASVPANLWEPTVDGSLVGTFFTNLLCVFCAAEMWQRAFAARNQRVARRGMIIGTVCFVITTFIIFYLGISGRALFPNLVEDYGTQDAVVPRIAMLLPAGIRGAAISGMLAVAMSSADSYLFIAAQSFSDDLYKTIKPDVTEKQSITCARILIPILACIAVVIALYIRSAFDACVASYSYYTAAMAAPCMAALYWNKATAPGILSGIAAGIITAIVWTAVGQPLGLNATIPGCIVSGLALLAVSTLTYKSHPSVVLETQKER